MVSALLCLFIFVSFVGRGCSARGLFGFVSPKPKGRIYTFAPRTYVVGGLGGLGGLGGAVGALRGLSAWAEGGCRWGCIIFTWRF